MRPESRKQKVQANAILSILNKHTHTKRCLYHARFPLQQCHSPRQECKGTVQAVCVNKSDHSDGGDGVQMTSTAFQEQPTVVSGGNNKERVTTRTPHNHLACSIIRHRKKASKGRKSNHAVSTTAYARSNRRKTNISSRTYARRSRAVHTVFCASQRGNN